MDGKMLCQYFLNELQAESIASRKCIQRIPADVYSFKPHEKSMEMGYLTLLVAEIPLWIAKTIEDSVINFATYRRFQLSTPEALLSYYEANLSAASNALTNITAEQLSLPFELKHGDQVLMSSPKLETIGSTINHWVHHRGQLTVYMRLNNIPVPSIYGPSADDRSF
ncbi:MAG: damage-inducible protein DinB [Bacteroidetes bacterium]|nr:damage-inducible protein DinB [Bacteroidota bacterium]